MKTRFYLSEDGFLRRVRNDRRKTKRVDLWSKSDRQWLRSYWDGSFKGHRKISRNEVLNFL